MFKRFLLPVLNFICVAFMSMSAPSMATTVTFSGTGTYNFGDILSLKALYSGGGFSAEPLYVNNGAITKSLFSEAIGLVSSGYKYTFSSVTLSALDPQYEKVSIVPLAKETDPVTHLSTLVFKPYNEGTMMVSDGSVHTYMFSPGTVGFFISRVEGSQPTVNLYGFSAVAAVAEPPSYILLLIGVLVIGIAVYRPRITALVHTRMLSC